MSNVAPLQDYLAYLTIPLVSGLVGYGTNWLAVKMMEPVEFYELLRPIVAEDEWKLDAVSAALDMGAGYWQWALLT